MEVLFSMFQLMWHQCAGSILHYDLLLKELEKQHILTRTMEEVLRKEIVQHQIILWKVMLSKRRMNKKE